MVVELMFLAINMFLALLRAHFNPRYARAKMILSRAKNIFMPANVNSVVILPRSIYTQYKRNMLVIAISRFERKFFFLFY